jgi:para-aminobenzoate synthetase component 1
LLLILRIISITYLSLSITGTLFKKKKKEELIVSQPIVHQNVFWIQLKMKNRKNKLALDPKERAENIMITDLVK